MLENHQERDDGRAGIDEELPRIRITKQRPGNRPDQNHAGRNHESRRTAHRQRRRVRDFAEEMTDAVS